MAIVLNTAGETVTAALDVDTNVDNNYGADGGNVQFAAFLNNVDSGLTSGGQHIFYSISTDGHTLTGYLDTNGSHTFDAGDVPVFTIALNLDNSVNLSNDTYTVNMVGTIDGGAETISFLGTGVNFVGGNDPWAGFTTASGQDLLLTPDEGFLRSGTINMDANAGGVGAGNSMGPGEIMALDFVNNLTGDPQRNFFLLNDYAFVANQDHVFTGHYTVNGAFATFTSTNGSEVRLTAWDDPDGNNVVQDGVEDSITQIAINYNNAQLLITEASIGIGHATDFTVGGHIFTVEFVQNGVHTEVLVDGIVGGNAAGSGPFTQIAAFTTNGYNELQIGYDSLVLGPEQQPSFSTFKLGGFGAVEINPGQPVDLSVPLTVTDGDGDTASGNLGITLEPPGASPFASVDFAGTLLTQANTESLVTIHFNEAVTGFGPNDLTLVGGTLSDFQQIDADTYTATFLVQPNFEGTGQVTLTGAYADLAGNPGITGAHDTIAINTLASTLDATMLTTGTSGVVQVVELTFVDLQNPIFSYAGLYDLGAQGGAFQRDAGFDIDPREYSVSLEATGGIPVPITVLTVEGVPIHII